MGLRIALIVTSPAGEKGSMARYAELVIASLSAQGVDIRAVNLALSGRILQRIPAKLRVPVHHIWMILTSPLRLWIQHADLYHVLDGSHAYVSSFIPSNRLIITSHDIIPLLLLNGRLQGKKPGMLGTVIIRMSIRNLERAQQVICVSNHTRNDLLDIGIPDSKLLVVHNALGYHACETPPEWRDRRFCDTPFAFHIGHNGYYKNREAVLRIFAGILIEEPEIRLKMAGPEPSREIVEIAEQLGISEKVDFIVDPDDETVSELYTNACLFLFPSRYEGFGWPPLEAMASGCPVVCSSAGSLAEVVENGAVTHDVENERAMVSSSIEILKNQAVAEDLIRRGYERIKHFKPTNMAKALLETYRNMKS